MTEITSIRNLWKFYLTIFAWVSFCLLMALFLGGLAEQGPSQGGGIAMIVMSAGMLCLALFIVIRYYKNAPGIVVNDKSISFNKKVYYWRDLEKIEMTGKRSFKFMGEKKEGALLKFKGQKEQHIFDDMYEKAFGRGVVEAGTGSTNTRADAVRSELADVRRAQILPAAVAVVDQTGSWSSAG